MFYGFRFSIITQTLPTNTIKIRRNQRKVSMTIFDDWGFRFWNWAHADWRWKWNCLLLLMRWENFFTWFCISRGGNFNFNWKIVEKFEKKSLQFNLVRFSRTLKLSSLSTAESRKKSQWWFISYTFPCSKRVCVWMSREKSEKRSKGNPHNIPHIVCYQFSSFSREDFPKFSVSVGANYSRKLWIKKIIVSKISFASKSRNTRAIRVLDRIQWTQT